VLSPNDVLDALTPPLASTRALALDPLREKTINTRASLARVADEHGDLAERAALIDTNKLKGRMTPDLFNAACRARTTAAELIGVLDRAELPIDVRQGFRECVGAPTDGAFATALAALVRDVSRYAGAARNAAGLAKKLTDDLLLLAEAEPLFAPEFQLQPETVTYK